jgi:PAS domain S-box-containing protein
MKQQPEHTVNAQIIDENWLESLYALLKWESVDDLANWGEPVLQHLAEATDALEGTVYRLSGDEKELYLTAWYAMTYQDGIPVTVPMGSGTIGLCARQQKKQFFLLEEQNFKAYTTGTEISPKCLVTYPLISNHRLTGVIEFSYLEEPQTNGVYMLEKGLPFVAAALDSILNEQRLRATLEASRDNEERLQTLARVGTEGIAFVDKGVITEHNLAFGKIFNFNDQDLKGVPITQFLTGASATQIDYTLNNSLELEGMNQDREIIQLGVESREVTYGQRTLKVFTFHDITKRKEAERELENSEKKLQEANQVIELTKEIEEKNKKITSSINYAKNIQEAILPREEEIGQHLEEFFIIYRCRDVVSGDFYWYAYPDEDTFLIAAVDCTGHGVPGAFMSLIGNTYLNSIVKHRRIKQPGEILKMLNHSVVKTLRQDEDSNSRDGMDIGLINLNFKNKTWKYSGAHRPLVKVSNGKLEEYKGTKAAIGGPPRFQRRGNFEEIKGSWKPGDMVYMYSDGFPDQFSPEGNKFLNKRLKESLVEISSLPCEQQKNALENQFDAWKGKAAQTDDVIMIGIRLG